MKVLFISTEDVKYGAPKSMQKLMWLLINNYGVECVLLTKKKNVLNEWCDKNGIKNYSCNYRDIMSGDSYESRLLNFTKHMVKKLRFIKGGFTQGKVDKLGIEFSSIDLIHSNTNRVDLGAYISKRYNIPHIWHLREMDEGTKNMHYYLHDWANYMNQSADCFVAITKAVKESWISHGLDGKKIKVIYNGIDSVNVVQKRSPILKTDVIKIVAVGRIEKAKGQLDIVNALCSMPKEVQEHFQIDFIGEAYADYKRLIVNKISKSKCKAEINFKGYCENVGEVLQDYDIGITCSAAEAFGRTTVEYMLAGLLTITSDTGANKELIHDKETGLIYEYGNIKELRELLQIIENNREQYAALAKNAFNYARNNFSAQSNAEKIYDTYKNVIKIKNK